MVPPGHCTLQNPLTDRSPTLCNREEGDYFRSVGSNCRTEEEGFKWWTGFQVHRIPCSWFVRRNHWTTHRRERIYSQECFFHNFGGFYAQCRALNPSRSLQIQTSNSLFWSCLGCAEVSPHHHHQRNVTKRRRRSPNDLASHLVNYRVKMNKPIKNLNSLFNSLTES